jgi:hypothetical protein
MSIMAIDTILLSMHTFKDERNVVVIHFGDVAFGAELIR